MIVFLNFTPIEFMGGAERWMYKMMGYVRQKEQALAVCVHESIANYYGRLVLKRNFEARATDLTNVEHITWSSFVPFTSSWRKFRNVFKHARVVYIRFELLEVLLLIYFGGFKSFKKAIAGLHSAFLYQEKIGFFDYLHTFVYQSRLCTYVLKKMHTVHVLNARDEKYLMEQGVKNIVRIPNSLPKLTNSTENSPANTLKLIFAGELSLRKGVDVLLDVIKSAPTDVEFYIAGNGPFAKEFEQLSKTNPNCIFKQYMGQEELRQLYAQCDALILPSRGEGFSLVILEALRAGLKVIVSGAIKLNMPDHYELVADRNQPAEYLSLIQRLKADKAEGVMNRNLIRNYFSDNFSDDIVMPKLLNLFA